MTTAPLPAIQEKVTRLLRFELVNNRLCTVPYHVIRPLSLTKPVPQVDYIFQEVAREANMSRVQLAQYAVQDTKLGVVSEYEQHKLSRSRLIDSCMNYNIQPAGDFSGVIGESAIPFLTT